MSGKAFFGGVPVAPDVDLLMESFKRLPPGTTITHAQVEEIICLDRATNRYRTVVQRWMLELWDSLNVRVVGDPGVGFRVVTGKGRLHLGERQRKKAVRRLAQAVKEAVTTPVDELTSAGDRLEREHLCRTNINALKSVKDAQHEFAISKQAILTALPKRKPPAEKEDNERQEMG